MVVMRTEGAIEGAVSERRDLEHRRRRGDVGDLTAVFAEGDRRRRVPTLRVDRDVVGTGALLGEGERPRHAEVILYFDLVAELRSGEGCDHRRLVGHLEGRGAAGYRGDRN